MRCMLLNITATTDILCGRKWAYSSCEPSLSHACAILNFDVSLFLQSDKWDGKWSRQKHTRTHFFPPQWCHNWKEQDEKTLYQKARGCHRMVTFCVQRHYDNEHAFSITNTSWAPFLLMYFSEGNGRWQSYLLHCIAGLFLEVRNKTSATGNCEKSISKQLSTMCYWASWEIKSVMKVITSTDVPLLRPVCWLWICMLAFWLTEQWWILNIKPKSNHRERCNCARLFFFLNELNSLLKSTMK